MADVEYTNGVPADESSQRIGGDGEEVNRLPVAPPVQTPSAGPPQQSTATVKTSQGSGGKPQNYPSGSETAESAGRDRELEREHRRGKDDGKGYDRTRRKVGSSSRRYDRRRQEFEKNAVLEKQYQQHQQYGTDWLISMF